MKELSIEEKAKRYDEAIAIAKEINNEQKAQPFNVMIKVFPELKESEDEKIRESLLEYLHTLPNHYAHSGVCAPEWIAWLEKQGEQKPYGQRQECADCQFNYAGECKGSCAMKRNEQKPADTDNKFIRMRETKPKDISEFLDRLTTVEQEFLWEHIAKIRELDKGEQKPDDKVEPKFKVGDWIVFNGLVLLIKEVIRDYYITISIGGIRNSYGYDIDNASRLWTIQDVKAGDVLVTNSGRPFIFKGYLDKMHPNSPVAYGGIDYNNYFYGDNDNQWWTDENVYPATKEQRDLLFQKIKEAGYEWNTEKKELNKI